MRRLIVSLFLVLTFVPASVSVAAVDQKELLKKIGIEQRVNQQLPLDAAFRDETGKAVRLGDYFGTHRPVILALVYYKCPMLCTLVLNGVGRTSRAMSLVPGKDYEVVALSFNPAETPDLASAKKSNVMKEFGRPGTENGWHFLTGDASQIELVTRAAGFRYAWDEESKEFAHAGAIMVATPQGTLYRYMMGIDYGPKDLRMSLVEASKGNIGSVIDQILLFCYHYDPVSGKYGFAVMTLVRGLALLTVFLIGGYIVASVRGERRRGSAVAGKGKAG